MLDDKIMALLCEICGAQPGELEPELELFEAGLLDSFGVVELMLKIEEELGIKLDIEDLPREAVSTPAKIISLIGKPR